MQRLQPLLSVAGGRNNTAGAVRSTVSAGSDDSASDVNATVGGGGSNSALDLDFTSSASNEFAVRAVGGVRFVTAVDGATDNPVAGVILATGSGTWASLSDRNAKENLDPVDGDEVLSSLDRVPISTWNYRSEDATVRHMGPMAQDFHAAFGLGGDDTHITTIDADGVSLAAVQELNRKLEREIERRDAEIRELRARLEALEAVLEHRRITGAYSR